MRYLYINGDSFCGDGIDDNKTYGELIAKKYNLDIKEEWLGGSSNHRIYRTTIDFIMNNQDILNEVFFIIGWSKYTRWEFFNCKKNKYIQLGHSSFFDGGGGVEWKKEYILESKFWKGYMSNFYDFEQMKNQYVQMVFSLQSTLQNYNCNYLFYNSFNDSVISQSNKNINFKRWVKPRSSFDGYLNNFKQHDVRQILNNDFMYFDDHPNEMGHQKWFEVISLTIDSKNIL